MLYIIFVNFLYILLFLFLFSFYKTLLFFILKIDMNGRLNI